MIERGYQYEYSRDNEAMHSKQGRQRKAETTLSILQEALGGRLAGADVLNLGCSTGIIDEFIAPHARSMTGVDIDQSAVALAESRSVSDNLVFRIDDAMGLSFSDESFDVVICSQVYEHVPDPVRMMREIDRVLRPGGVCYFAATNRWALVEKHHHLPLLSWLPPGQIANLYVRLLGSGDAYYERHLGYGPLLNLASAFRVDDWTGKIIGEPEKYAALYMFRGRFKRAVAKAMYTYVRAIFPGFIWLLWKKDNGSL